MEILAVLTVWLPSVFKKEIPKAEVTRERYWFIVSILVVSTFGSTYSIFSTHGGEVYNTVGFFHAAARFSCAYAISSKPFFSYVCPITSLRRTWWIIFLALAFAFTTSALSNVSSIRLGLIALNTGVRPYLFILQNLFNPVCLKSNFA